MKRILLLSLILLFGSGSLLSQEISISPNSLQIRVNTRPLAFTDTIRTGDQLTYRVVYQNTGTDTLITPVDLIIRGIDSLATDTLFDQQQATAISPGDTLARFYADSVSAGHAIYGANGGGAIVIVVWPSVRNMPNIPVRDSSNISLYRDYPASIPSGATPLFSIYPNPTISHLNIEYGSLKNKVDCVRIMDGFGRKISEHMGNPQRLITTQLPVGQYWIQLRLRDGHLLSLPFIKQR